MKYLKKTKFLIAILITIIIIYIYLYYLKIFVKKSFISNSFKHSSNYESLKIVDLSKHLTSKETFNSIPCRKSIEVYVSTTLCVHDLKKDAYVSRAIWEKGIWEAHVLNPFLNYVKTNPDALVIDLGSQVGEFSLFAAKMGRKVIAVEPFYDNILRIQKAVLSEGLQDRIILLKNAVSNKRNEIKRLSSVSDNIGAQSFLKYRNDFYNREEIEFNRYLAETILFDDIIKVFPKRSDGKIYNRAILKIDVEGFEPFAFQSAHRLFEVIEIPIIFMEWGYLVTQNDLYDDIEEMIKFLTDRRYVAYVNNEKLYSSKWKKWPNDIYWLKEYNF